MKKALLFASILSLLSCSNPMNKKYNEKNLEKDIREIADKNKISKEDSELLAGWLVLAKLGNKDLTGKTYQNILDEAKAYKKEQNDIETKAKEEEKAKEEKMKNAATISIYEYQYVPADRGNYELQDYHRFKYAIKNKSSNEIKALKFHFKIYNSLGDEIGNGYEISVTDNRIAPQAIYNGSVLFDSNSYNSDDSKIINAKFEDLRFDIVIDKIVYEDNTTLE